jgi:hypothetical protein
VCRITLKGVSKGARYIPLTHLNRRMAKEVVVGRLSMIELHGAGLEHGFRRSSQAHDAPRPG